MNFLLYIITNKGLQAAFYGHSTMESWTEYVWLTTDLISVLLNSNSQHIWNNVCENEIKNEFYKPLNKRLLQQ